jgi:hypothetical protein
MYVRSLPTARVTHVIRVGTSHGTCRTRDRAGPTSRTRRRAQPRTRARPSHADRPDNLSGDLRRRPVLTSARQTCVPREAAGGSRAQSGGSTTVNEYWLAGDGLRQLGTWSEPGGKAWAVAASRCGGPTQTGLPKHHSGSLASRRNPAVGCDNRRVQAVVRRARPDDRPVITVMVRRARRQICAPDCRSGTVGDEYRLGDPPTRRLLGWRTLRDRLPTTSGNGEKSRSPKISRAGACSDRSSSASSCPSTAAGPPTENTTTATGTHHNHLHAAEGGDRPLGSVA